MPPGEPPAAIQLAVYRILQEALTNALRHGTGGVDVRLSWWADAVDVMVSNTVDASKTATSGGHGVIGMRERAQLVGGTLQAERHGDRFVVSTRLPIGPSSSSRTGVS
jgi:signal transduction histidine kinase